MSRRDLVLRIFMLILAVVAVGGVLLALCVFFLLDLGPAARRQEWIKTGGFGLASLVFLNALIWSQLQAVWTLLGQRERNQPIDSDLADSAHLEALGLPNRLIVQLLIWSALIVIVGLIVDLTISGYEWLPDLLSQALVLAFLLGIGLILNVGLRILLQPFLATLGTEAGRVDTVSVLGSFSIRYRFMLITGLVTLIILLTVIAFALSFMIRATDESVGQAYIERVQAAADALEQMPNETLVNGLVDYAQSGETWFVLNQDGHYVGWLPRQRPTNDEIEQLISGRTINLTRDYAMRRFVAVPMAGRRFFCLTYRSQALNNRTIRAGALILGLLFVILSGLGLLIAFWAGRDMARTVRNVTARLDALADQTLDESLTALPQTTLDEVGDLVQALNRVQRRTAEYTAQLERTVLNLKTADTTRQSLLKAMTGLTAPVLPVETGIVVVLLSGHFNDDRAALIQPNFLEGIAKFHARFAIVDLTALAEVSPALVFHLPRALRAVRLMGCRLVITGAGPQVALALSQQNTRISGDMPLHKMPARRSLADGLTYARDWLSQN